MYTGTPGSGKSLHAAQEILDASLRGQQVIANFPIKPTKKQQRTGKLPLYWDNGDITVKRLIQYARKNHKRGKEGQTLLIIDECAILFNCRAFNAKGREQWVKFFSQHRKYGYNIIMITQWDRMLDRQIRVMAEYNVVHRKVNNFRLIGLLLTMCRIKLFVAIEMWYGVNEITTRSFFRFRRKLADMYDSYAEFHGWDEEEGELEPEEAVPGAGSGGQGDPPAGSGTDRAELMARLAAALAVRVKNLEPASAQPLRPSARLPFFRNIFRKLKPSSF
jgi:zona occludens toxin (predicted ATPase)